MLRDETLDEDLLESEVELDNSDVVDPDLDLPVEMGDPSAEVNEESRRAAQVSASKAMDAILEGDLDQGINHLTAAIILNPISILYASRASVFLKLKKPNAAIRDAGAALEINPSSAKGYKARGMAKALLGLWEEAASDLQVASELDFDEETSLMLKKVKLNVTKIEEHQKKYQRLRMERELRKIELRRLRISKETELTRKLKDGQVIEIESANELGIKLNASSKLSRLAVLYFTATWCGPCCYIAATYESLAARYPKVVFLKIDIDEVTGAAAVWNITSIPCFYLTKNGEVIDKIVEIDLKLLEKMISEHAG